MVFDAVYQKKRDTNVSPVIIKIYVPTLALSKSGNGLKRYSLLSARLHKHPLSQLQSVYHLDMGKSI